MADVINFPRPKVSSAPVSEAEVKRASTAQIQIAALDTLLRAMVKNRSLVWVEAIVNECWTRLVEEVME